MEKIKVLLFGATGMAGHIVYHYLDRTEKYNIVNSVFRDKLTEESIVVDVTNTNAVRELITDIRPEVIINCIGVLVKDSNNNPDNAILLNAYLPHLLKKYANQVNAKLIHISTDCVFSGNRGSYTEKDFKDADDVYGRSKALGEINNDKDATIRTSIIGPEIKTNGEGLFHWFMMQKGSINGYTKAYWGGITTLELAKAVDKVIENNITGVVHVTNGEKISKYDLLHLFKDIFNKLDVEIAKDNKLSVDKSLIISSKFDFEVPSYNRMIKEMADWIYRNKEFYHQYLK